MKHSLSVILGVALMAALIFAPAAAPTSAYSNTYHFDSTLAPWLPGSDFGAFDKQSLVREPWEGSPICSFDGDGYASLVDYFSPNKGEGSWMVASIEGQGPTNIELRWNMVYKVQSATWCSKGCDVTAYIGTSLPTDSAEFTALGELPGDWKALSYNQSLALDGTAHVAIGWRIHTLDVLSDLALTPTIDKEMVVNVDCLTVTARPIGK